MVGQEIQNHLAWDYISAKILQASFGKLLEHGDEIVKTLKDLGFVYITMDLEGFRSGSMDVGLDK